MRPPFKEKKMIEVYSQNIEVQENSFIPLNGVALKKGNSVVNSGTYDLVFNNCGIYVLTVSASASAATANSTLEISLVKDGISVPQAFSSVTAATEDSNYNLSFSTLIQVSKNNTPCVCSSPTICSIKNTGSVATFNNIDVVVTKLV